MARTVDEKKELIRAFSKLKDSKGIPAAEKEVGISVANYYKMRQDVRAAGHEVPATVNVFQVDGSTAPKPAKIKRTAADTKCVVIVTTATSLRSVLDGIF